MGKYDVQRKKITYVILHHTATLEDTTWQTLSKIGQTRTYAGYTHSEHYDIETKEETYIAYHWLVYQNGTVRQCLRDEYIGWHAGNWGINCAAIAISFVGNFVDKNPSDASLKAAGQILKLYSSVKLKGHKEIKATACPGRVLDFKDKIIAHSKESNMTEKIVLKGNQKAAVYTYEEGKVKLLQEEDFDNGTYEWSWVKELKQSEIDKFVKLNNLGATLLLKDPSSAASFSLDTKNKKWKSYTKAEIFLEKYEFAWLYVPDDIETYIRLKNLYTSVDVKTYNEVNSKLKLAQISIKSLEKSQAGCEATNKKCTTDLVELTQKHEALVKLQTVKEREFDELVVERNKLKNGIEICDASLATVNKKYTDDLAAKDAELKVVVANYGEHELELLEQMKINKEQCNLTHTELEQEIAELRKQCLSDMTLLEIFRAFLAKIFNRGTT